MRSVQISHTQRRLFEILPGLLTWSALILPIVLSQFTPELVVAFVILFDLYWVYKAVIMAFHLVMGYRLLSAARSTHWLPKAKRLTGFDTHYQGIIVATYKEELEVLESTFEAIAESDYPLKNLIVVLATEARDKERAAANAAALKKRFGSLFYKFIVTIHPDDIVGEVKGKGGNITWAARELQKKLNEWQIPYKDVMITTLDADNRVDKQYFASLAYNYFTHPDPIHVSFQPIPMFFNNVWEAPIMSRLIAHNAMFWVMIEATRPWRLRNFSSHSQSMQALVDIDFWSTNTIVEDGHQYWRSYYAYNGNYSVVPIYVPIYQDAIVGKTLFDSAKELYLQQRRWAWGASDLPYIIENNLKNTSIPWFDKWGKAGRALETYFSWATYSLYIMVTGWIPILLNDTFSDTVLAYNFPIVASNLLTTAMVGLIATLMISSLVAMAFDHKKTPFAHIAAEWLLIPLFAPVTSIIFGAFPALDAQTRLMIGKYLEFRVTVKARTVEGHKLSKLTGI